MQKKINNSIYFFLLIMARSRWKLAFFSRHTWSRINHIQSLKKFEVRRMSYDRSSTIPECIPFMVINIHKGKKFRSLFTYKFVSGYKFGEFSFTRKPFHFPMRKSLKRKN